MTSRKDLILITFSLLISLLLGIIIGRKCFPEERTIVKYVPGETITDTLTVVNLVEIHSPVDTSQIIKTCIASGTYMELFPVQIKDSIIYVPTEVDTLKILADWATHRKYSEQLFCIDTVGTCIVDIDVQYNRLNKYTYRFTPVTKVSTIERVKSPLFEPMVGVGIFTDHRLNLSVGTYIRSHYGVMYMPIYDYINNSWSHSLQLTYKF